MTTRVYRLDIVYPEGCRLPGWHPARWTDPGYLATLTREQRREVRRLLRKPFKWPRERLFLSSSGAHARAWRLRFYGATVEVEGSLPVTWLNLDAGEAHWQEYAAHWHPVLADYADAMPLAPVTTPPEEKAREQEDAWRAERERQTGEFDYGQTEPRALAADAGEFPGSHFEPARGFMTTEGAMSASRMPGDDITMTEYQTAARAAAHAAWQDMVGRCLPYAAGDDREAADVQDR
jgi:hypothetical protein